MKKVWGLGLIINIVLLIVFNGIFLFSYFNNVRNIGILGSVSLFFWLLIPLLYSKTFNKFDLFAPLTIINIAYFLYMVYSPISDILIGRLYFGRDLINHIPKGALHSILGIIFLYIGYLSATYFLKFKLEKKNNKVKEIINKEKAIKITKILAIISFAFFTMYTFISGNSWIKLITFGQSGNIEAEMLKTSSLSNYLLSFIDCFISLYLILIFITKKYKRYTIIFFPILIATISLGFRFRILIFIFAPFITYYLVYKKRPSKKQIIIILILIFIMVGVLGSIRGNIRAGKEIDNKVNFEEIYEQFMINNAIYQPFYAMTHILPVENQFYYGKTFTYVFLHPIPRSLWKNKPDPPVREIVNILFNDERIVNAGMAYPNIGEFYVNFGVIGICIGMFIFGFYVSLVYRKIKLTDGYFSKIKYGILYFFILQYVSRGYFVQIFTEYIFLFAPLYIVKKFCVRYKVVENEE